MRHLVALSILCVVLLSGCGTFVGFVSNPGAPTTVKGTVTLVHLEVTDNGSGTSVKFTAVTLVDADKQATLSICGDHVGLFPLNQFVQVNLTTGTPCSTLIGVVVI